MNIFKHFILLTGFYSSLAMAEVREIKRMAEILPEISQDTAVVFDLDNTVIEPEQTIGRDQFFGWLMQGALNRGMPQGEALNWAITGVTPIAPHVHVHPVERSTPKIIETLQRNNVLTFALTARPPNWARGTMSQLRSIGVDFSHSNYFSRETKIGPQGVFTGGVVFVALGNKKGPVLLSFLKGLHLNLKKVIFIDDKSSNTDSVEEAFKAIRVRNINFRYGALDPKVKAFDSNIAQIEWTCYKNTRRIISDSVAREIEQGVAKCD